MSNWHLGMLLKPLVVVAMLMLARPLGKLLLARLPDGRIKRILSFRWDA